MSDMIAKGAIRRTDFDLVGALGQPEDLQRDVSLDHAARVAASAGARMHYPVTVRAACDILQKHMADGATTDRGEATESSGRIPCPHCGAEVERRVEATIVDCTACGRSFAAPRAKPIGHAGATATRAAFESIQARSPTDVGMRRTGALAAVVTLVFYVAIVTPLSQTYFGELFGARGWVPYVIAWMSAWAGLLLAGKAALLRSQRKALALDLLPEEIGLRITRENAESFQRHLRDMALQKLPQPRLFGGGAAHSFLVERIERALEHFHMRGRAGDVTHQLGNQSQLDSNAVESSYTMIRIFIWAIPLLGFIGTVLGISAAVAGFSDSVASAVDLDVMKQSIGAVTTGLGVAFDTTLLALVMSIAIMFPTSSLQKAEEDFLDRVDSYCELRLARRLDDRSPSDAPGDDALALGAAHGTFATLGSIAEGASQGLAQLEEQLAQLATTVGALDERMKRGSGESER